MDLSSIHESLAKSPHKIEQAALDIVLKKQALDQAKRQLERCKANVIISKGDSAKNQSVLNALVISDPDVERWEGAVIEANAAHMMAIARHEKARDEFDSTKKNANLIEAEMRSFSTGRSPSNQ